ncbi:hypothetical protein WN944_020902 [Citrus x changshan-huyou]|uniref:Myb-like domain-containing protein n=1 Tax=Citrus x changshan-huyou TaxID=2935761 RepID=A0AAP0R2E4_9ROSI
MLSSPSTRGRWLKLNHLLPNIVKHVNSTKEEEDVIINIHMQVGNKWSAMAKKLAHGSANDIRDQWRTIVRKRFLLRHTSPSLSLFRDDGMQR